MQLWWYYELKMNDARPLVLFVSRRWQLWLKVATDMIHFQDFLGLVNKLLLPITNISNDSEGLHRSMDTLHQALATHGFYHYLITNYANPVAMESGIW